MLDPELQSLLKRNLELTEENNRLIRPKSLYEGPAHMAFVPIEER